MVKTIRVTEEFHGWIAAHNAGEETMEETLRRLVLDRGGAHAASRFGADDAERARTAVAALRARDADRLHAAREAV